MNKQQRYKLEQSRLNWIAIAIAFITGFILLFVLVVFFPEETKSYKQGFQDGQANMLNFTDTLELINNNCGSVFFTKQYGQTEFSIFAQKCLGDGFCKPAYKTIEECLK